MLSLLAIDRSRLAVVTCGSGPSKSWWAPRAGVDWAVYVPPQTTHIKLVCMTKLACGQYATAWATTAKVESIGAKADNRVDVYRRFKWIPRVDTIALAGNVTLSKYTPSAGGAAPSSPWFAFKSTHSPLYIQNVELGCPQLGYLSPAVAADYNSAQMWCACCGLAAIIANYDGETPMDDDAADMMLAVSLRSIYPKYVTEKNIHGKAYDVRDPIGLSMLTNNDCDGAAILVCQFYNNVRALLPGEIAAADASDAVKRIATQLARRAHAYSSEPALVFGMALSPSKGPYSAPFGHAWVALVAIDPARPNLHIEATAPLGVLRGGVPPKGFGRVYAAGEYPPSIKGVDARGVRAFEPWMYRETWAVISIGYSVLFKAYPPWTEHVKWDTEPHSTAAAAARLGVEERLYPTLPLRPDDGATSAPVRSEHITDFKQFDRAIGVGWLLGGDAAAAKTDWVVQCGPFVAIDVFVSPPE